MTNSILLDGVGGQGTILASKLLTIGLMEAGYDVKMSEIHGMSQRGGSVSSQVRYGDKVYSPVIEIGGADILVSFEKMEALRWLKYLKSGGKLIVNDYKINSMPIITGKVNYLEDEINEELKRVGARLVDASNDAIKLGNPKTMNIILLRSLVKYMNLENIDWNKIISDNVKKEFIDINIKAFEVGMNLVKGE